MKGLSVLVQVKLKKGYDECFKEREPIAMTTDEEKCESEKMI
jgi:hypothetical protein